MAPAETGMYLLTHIIRQQIQLHNERNFLQQ